MTVSTSVYKAGPYAGSGTTGPFTVTFRFLANSHLRVIKTSTTGSETTLNLGVDYSVTGAGGASGTVTLTSPLLVGEKLTIVRNVPLTQETDYVNDDSFPAESHEQALDKLTMITQQLAEEVDRAVKVLPSSTDDPDALIDSIRTSEQNAAASAAAAAASYDLFDDRYLGSKTSNPTLDNDGNPLQVGAEYWNSVSNERRTWTGSAWVSSVTVVPDASVTTAKLADGAAVGAKLGSKVQSISASVAANAITVSASYLSLDFRSTTLTSGTVTTVTGTPANLAIASTDSFGLVTASGNQRIAILAINNAGTIELAAASLFGSQSLDETGVITTVTAATTGTQIKSATARTNVAYRVIGFVDATFTTGTGWGSLTVVQGQGGVNLIRQTAINLGTSVASTSGTSIDFTGIPSWVNRITVMFRGVSLSGSSYYLVQVGSGTFQTSGYESASGVNAGGNVNDVITSASGFIIRNSAGASALTRGAMVLSRITGNTWVSSHSLADRASVTASQGGGDVALSGALDRVRITTVNGTDTFDAGTINIAWE